MTTAEIKLQIKYLQSAKVKALAEYHANENGIKGKAGEIAAYYDRQIKALRAQLS